MIVTASVIFPVVKALAAATPSGFVIVTMLVEIAMISSDSTVLYVLQGMRPNPGPITDIFTGVMPFLFVYVLAIVILLAAPELSLWLPGVMR